MPDTTDFTHDSFVRLHTQDNRVHGIRLKPGETIDIHVTDPANPRVRVVRSPADEALLHRERAALEDFAYLRHLRDQHRLGPGGAAQS